MAKSSGVSIVGNYIRQHQPGIRFLSVSGRHFLEDRLPSPGVDRPVEFIATSAGPDGGPYRSSCGLDNSTRPVPGFLDEECNRLKLWRDLRTPHVQVRAARGQCAGRTGMSGWRCAAGEVGCRVKSAFPFPDRPPLRPCEGVTQDCGLLIVISRKRLGRSHQNGFAPASRPMFQNSARCHL